ncbi:MAG: signal recognition particle protein [Planctomycetota bacterium]
MLGALSASLQKTLGKLRGVKTLTEENVQEGLRDIRRALLEADVHFLVAKSFVDSVKGKVIGTKLVEGVDPSQQFVKALHDELTAFLGGEHQPLARSTKGPTVILMAGLQGSGKTTTCGKLSRMLKEEGRKVLLVAADLQRPAAVEQLRILGRQLGVDVHAEGGKSPPEVCRQAVERAGREGFDTVILDTAGRLHVDEDLMREVEAVSKATSPHETLLVMDSMTGQDAVQSAEVFSKRLSLTGLILTKLDGDTRGGAALSLRHVTGQPIRFLGMGEKLDKIEPLHPERLAGRILGMGDVVTLVEKAQSAISEDEAMGLMQKMVSGKMGLDDLVNQMRMIKKMGPLKSVLGLLPGVGSMLKDADLEQGEEEMARLEALVQSMTPEERRQPDLIDSSRRARVARGSGRSTKDVQNLLKQFQGMKRMMRSIAPMAQPGAGMDKDKLRAMRREMMKLKP